MSIERFVHRLYFERSVSHQALKMWNTQVKSYHYALLHYQDGDCIKDVLIMKTLKFKHYMFHEVIKVYVIACGRLGSIHGGKIVHNCCRHDTLVVFNTRLVTFCKPLYIRCLSNSSCHHGNKNSFSLTCASMYERRREIQSCFMDRHMGKALKCV